MKKAIRFALLVLSVCLCMMLFASCGAPGFESIGEELLKEANESNSFDNTYDFDCIGAINDTAVELEGMYWKQQSETSGNIYDYIYNNARIGEVMGREFLTLYLSDGLYYFEEEETFTCVDRIVTEEPTPGRNFWKFFAEAEKLNADEESLNCTVTLSGDQLKETIKEYCPRIYNEVAPYADWNAISGDIFVDLSDLNYVEEMRISCPALGEIMIQTIDPEAAAKCTDFDIDIFCSYYDPEVIEPGDKAIAKEGEAPIVYGMNALIKFLMGENEEAEEIIAEEEAEKNFTPVRVEEGSVTLSTNGVNVTVAVPSDIEIYSDINHIEADIALLTHDIMSGASGRTIVQLTRGTTDDFFQSLGLKASAAKDAEINGIAGKLLTEKFTDTNFFGQKVYNENYFFAADVGGAILGIRFEGTYNENHVGVLSEETLHELMNYITVG